MLDVNVATLKRQGKRSTTPRSTGWPTSCAGRYDRETDIRYAAARLWIDAIIDPARTREVLDPGLRCRHPPRCDAHHVGVFQV